MEEEKTRGSGGNHGVGGSAGHYSNKRGIQNDDQLIPRNLLRRIDVENRIWVLVEYEPIGGGDSRSNIDDKWISFDNDEDLDDKCTFCDNFTICCSCCDSDNACSTHDIQMCIPEEKHARAESNNVDLTRSTMYGY